MSQEQQKDESILIKIKKLMDKAASTDSQAEADSFMLKAQQLLQQYNLDMSDVKSVKLTSDTDINEADFGYEETWERDLMVCIADNYFCKAYTNSHSAKVLIFGTASNIEVAIYLISFYRNALLNLSLPAYKEFLKDKQDQFGIDVQKIATPKAFEKVKNKFLIDYLHGGVDGIRAKLLEQQKNSSENVKSLIFTNNTAIEKFVSDKYTVRYSNEKNYQQKGIGYAQGYRDGKGISVNQGVGTQQSENRGNKIGG